MRILAIICARGGSKGVPGKNIRPLLGKPLIAYTIEQALGCDRIDRVIVSTDDKEIARVSKECGADVPFIRPIKLAGDNSPKLLALQHTVEEIEKSGDKYDIILDLDPTSPLRNSNDIRACIEKLENGKNDTDTVITVYKAHHNPYFNMVELDGEYMRLCKKPEKPIPSRQLAPKVYQMNACVTAIWRDVLMSSKDSYYTDKTKIVIMPPERSVMIDTEIEFKLAEILLKESSKGEQK